MPAKFTMAMPYFPPEEREPILNHFKKILDGDEMLSMGKKVAEFECEFASYCGVPYAVATNSCSAALEIAFRILNFTEGDEVIVPAETFIATPATVIREKGRPVFAEINPETFCLSADDLEKKITPRTRAVVIVHMAGLITPEIERIQALCTKNNLTLIEDAAHAPGATYKGAKSGSFGDMACFSFYPTKVITTAEGGMLVTRNENLYRQANSYRHRGLDLSAGTEAYAFVGSNNRMTEFAAVLGLSQLKVLDGFIQKRNDVAQIYHEALKNSDGIFDPLPLPGEARHSYWRYIVRVTPGLDRVALKKKMAEAGVDLDWAYDPPVHLQPVFKKLYHTTEGMLPCTEETMRHFICLPIHPGISKEDALFIANTLKETARNLA